MPGRWLVFRFVASVVLSIVFVSMLWPSWLDQTPSPPLPEAISGLVCYGLLLAFMIRPLHRSGASLRILFRRPAAPTATRWAISTGVAVLGISMASLYAVFLPLSYARPDFVQWWLIEDPVVLIWTHGDHYPIANLLNFLFVILIGPFIEELFFRGLLLASWASRWGPTRAVIFSSLLFAVLHLGACPSIQNPAGSTTIYCSFEKC